MIKNIPVIREVTPEGVEIKADRYGGLGIFATRDFKVGETVQKSHFILITDSVDKVILKLDDGEESHDLFSYIHGYWYGSKEGGVRSINGFGAFTNHSCDPSVHCVDLDDEMMYRAIALKNIKAGDEITENYNQYEWDKDDVIEECLCGAGHECSKVISGFRNIENDMQCRMLAMASEEVRELWLEEHRDILFIEIETRKGVKCVKEESMDEVSIVADHKFLEDEIIFQALCTNIDKRGGKKVIFSLPSFKYPGTSLRDTIIIDLPVPEKKLKKPKGAAVAKKLIKGINTCIIEDVNEEPDCKSYQVYSVKLKSEISVGDVVVKFGNCHTENFAISKD